MATPNQPLNALDQFVAKARDLFTEERDLERRWELLLRPALAELLADPTVLEASRSWPVCQARDGRAENLLFYTDPDFDFAINGSVRSGARPAGERTRIHDHGHIYTLYGVLDGHERIERFEPAEEGQRPDYRPIKRTVDLHIGPGDIDLVRPYEIHSEIALGEQRIAVIVRSQKAGDHLQGRYDAETGAYYESLGPFQTPCQMLPSNQ